MSNQIDNDNEIPKYLKQKESNVSKAKKKAKHKHQYEECLIKYKCINDFDRSKITGTKLRSYCTICGKINGMIKDSIVTDYKRKEIRSNGQTYYHYMSDEELYKRYHDKLPVFFIEDIFKDGYVNFEENEK